MHGREETWGNMPPLSLSKRPNPFNKATRKQPPILKQKSKTVANQPSQQGHKHIWTTKGQIATNSSKQPTTGLTPNPISSHQENRGNKPKRRLANSTNNLNQQKLHQL
jgi:hypothetical protein